MKTDSKLKHDVSAELQWEPSVTSKSIAVDVHHGAVTLTGKVASYSEQRNAGRAALRVWGVANLKNEIKVALPGDHRRSDSEITMAAENALEATTSSSGSDVKVRVKDGWLTLSGDLEWQYQRTEAADSVRHLHGVTGLTDEISIKPRLPMTAVKADIENALKRRTASDEHEISVELKGTRITLTGRIHSWQERKLAMHTAWSTPGISNVEDKMLLAA